MVGRVIIIFLLVGVVAFLIYGCGTSNDPLLSSTLRDDGLPPAVPTWKSVPYDVENIWQDRYKVTLKWNKVTTNKDGHAKNNIAGYKILKADVNGNLVDTFLVEARAGDSDEFYVDTSTDLVEGKEYTYRIIAFDTFLRESPASAPQLVKIQVTLSNRPMPPQNFYWVPGNREVTIYWSPVTSYEDGTSIDGNLYGYELYRSTGNDTPDIPLAILDPEQTSYVDKYIELGQTYHYWIRSVDRNGAKSSFSSPISVILNVPTPPGDEDQYKDAVNIPNPPHPTSVTAINNANGTVTWTINWEAPYYNSDGTTYDDHSYYKIYRADSYEGPYSMLATSSTTTYSYTTASATKYYYKIQSVDKYGNESDLSGSIYLNATIPSMNSTDLNFRVDNNASTSTSIVLKWNDLYASSADLQVYYVYRALQPQGPYYRIGSVTDSGTERTYTDTKVVQNMTYYYRITGANTYGESEFSYYASGVAAKPSYVFEAENGVLIDQPKYPNETEPDIDTSNIQFRAIPGADYSGSWALFYEPGDTTVSPLTDHHFCVSALVLPSGSYTVKIKYEKGPERGNYTISLYGEASSLVGSSFGNLESTPITDFSVNGYDTTVSTTQIQEDTITNVTLDEEEQYYIVVYYNGGGGSNVGERGLVLDRITFEGQ